MEGFGTYNPQAAAEPEVEPLDVNPPQPKQEDPNAFGVYEPPTYTTPSPVATQPQEAPKQFGPTIEAARELPHPLTKEVERNLKLMENTTPTNDEENEAVAKLLVQRMGLRPDVDPETGEELQGPPQAAKQLARNMHPEQRRLMLERQDIQESLKQAKQTRLRMAVDAEAAAVIKGHIAPLAASEKAIESLGLEVRPPYIDYLKPLPREKVTFAEGMGNAVVRGVVRYQMNNFMENAEELIIAAQDADKPLLDVLKDSFIDPATGMVRVNPDQVFGQVIPRLFERIVSDETSLDKAKEAAAFLEKAMARYKTMGDIQFSDAAQPFMAQMNAISEEGGKLGQAGAFIKAMRDNPLSATAFFSEVMGEQAPTIAAALATRRLPAGIVLAPATSVASAYYQERYTPAVEALKKEFGIDLTTAKGQEEFLGNAEAIRRQIDFSKARAIPIAAFAGLSMWTASKSLASTATGNIVAQTPVQAFLGGAGEAGAGLMSLGEIDVVETLVEALAEAHPGQVMADIAIAGQQDVSEARRKKRAEAWLKGNTEVSGHINGIPTESLRTASEVLAEKWKGQGVDSVLLSASELMRFDQDGDIDVVSTLGLDPDEVKTAADEGQDVQIDTATFVRHILGKDGFSELLRHTRTDAEEFTPAEAEKFDELEADVLAKINQEAMDRITRSLGVEEQYLDDFLDDANAIRTEVERMLQTVGQYSPRESGLFAQLTAQRYMARAIRATKAAGSPVRAMDLFLEDNLQIQGKVEGAPMPTFEQVQKEGFKDERLPELEQAARDRMEGKITQEEYNAKVSELKPILPYKSVPVPATVEEMVGALHTNKREKVGLGSQYIGDTVGLRLDIPAYIDHDVWVPTIHQGVGKPTVLAHEAAAKIDGGVTFIQPEDSAVKKAARIGAEGVNKGPFAQITGTLQSVDPAALEAEMQAALNDPAWTQVGYDPRRHTFFYDRKTQRPVLSADEVIQVGPLVLAKNAKFAEGDPFLFQDGEQDVTVTQEEAALEEASVKAKDALKKHDTKITSQKTTIKKLKTGISPKEEKAAEKEGRDPVPDLPLGTAEQIEKAETRLAELVKQRDVIEQEFAEAENAALPGRQRRAEARAATKFSTIPGTDTSIGGGLTDRDTLHIADIEGAYVIPIFADLTATGKLYDSLSGIPVAPTKYFGGPNFSWLKQYREDGIVWAFNKEGVITGLQNHVRNLKAKMIAEGKPPRVVITVQAMAQTAHLSNSMVSGALLKTLDAFVTQGQVSHDTAVKATEFIRSKSNNASEGYSELATFPELDDAEAVHEWLRSGSTFTGRKALSTVISLAKFNEIEGMFPVARVIREAIDEDYAGTQTGDTVLAFEIDPDDPDLIAEFDDPVQNVAGVDTHPSYKYGMRGKLLGVFATKIPQSVMYGPLIDEMRAAGKSGESKFLLERLPNGENEKTGPAAGQLVTPEIVAEAQLIEDIGDYRTAHAYTSVIAGEWSDSKTNVNKGGVSPAEYERAIQESAGRALLSEISRDEVVKNKNLTVYQLGSRRVKADGEAGLNVFMGVEKNYDYSAGYYADDPSVKAAFKRGDLTKNEVALVGVVNNERSVKGLGSWLVLKAIEEKVTVLDAFDVRKPSDTAGKLPTIYGTLGFDEVARVPFDEQYLTDEHIATWEADGWVQGMPYPDIVVMKWRGDENERTGATRRFIQTGQIATGPGSLLSDEHDASWQRIQDDDGADGEAGGVAGQDQRRADTAKLRTRQRDVSRRVRHFVEGVLRADDVAVDALKLPKDRIAAIRKTYEDLPPLPDVTPPAEPAFEQSTAQGPARGGFTPSDLIQDQEGNPVNLIEIFEKGDTSTFLHESGHFWLEQLKSDAARFGDSFEKDWNTVVKWWQSRSEELKEEAIKRARKEGDKAAVAALQKMTAAQVRTYAGKGDLRGEGHQRYITVAMHEQFARGVEKYFETGEAPSMALLDAFIAFSNFIKSVYRRIRGQRLDVEFSPEVKDVLDRMLASDAEIELAASQYELTALFETAEEAGVTPQKFQEMQEATAKAKDRAKAKQLSKHIKEKQRERLEWYQDEVEKLRPDVEATVAEQREYRLLYALTQGGQADGSTLPEELLVNRIDRKALIELMPEDRVVEELPRVDNRAIYEVGTKEGNTASPAIVAGTFGFASPEEMIETLLEMPSYDQAVQSAIDAEMKARHGDIDVDGIGEATASIHSDPVTGVLMSELQALRTTEPAFDAKFLRYYAKKRLAELPVGQSQPYKFLAAEKRHAKLAGKALKKGDRATAYQHQFQRVLNHEMAKQAIRFQDEHRKITKYLRTFQLKRKKWKGIDADYVDNIKNIVNRLDFGSKVSERARLNAELKALNDFIEQEENGGAILELPQWLLEKDAKKNFRDMTVGELREVNDAVKMLERQGRNKKRATFGKEQREMRAVVGDMRRALVGDSNAITTRLRRAGGKAHLLHGPASVVTKVDSVLLKIEQLMEAIDGQPLGAWHQALYQPFADAAAEKQDMMKAVTDAINEKLKNLPKKVRKNMGKRVDVGDLGTEDTVFTRSMLIMLALNTGNQSNLDKLIRGYEDPDGPNWNISEELIDNALDQLTKEEWELVQEIWDIAERMWPKVDAIYRAENGRSPDRIEPRPIKTRHGEFKGGYFPMMYDTTIPGGDGKRSMLEQMTALEMMQSQVGRSSVNSSMTKERSDSFFAPVSLEIHKLPQGFHTTTHFITHYKAVQQARRLMTNKELRGDLERKVGIEYAQMIDNWIAAMAGDNTHLDVADSIVAALGRNTTVAILGVSYTTMMAQTLGVLTTFDRLTADNSYTPGQALVTTGDIAHGLSTVFSKEHREKVYELSGEMRHRLQNTDRELRNGMRALEGKKGFRANVQMMAMMSVAGMQLYTVDFPTWTAAYNRMMRDSGQDVEKSVAYADRVLRLSQSGGGEKDLSAIQRKRGLWKAATMFYSFFSVLYGILRQIGGEVVDKPNPMTVLRAASRIFVVLTLQELGMALIRGELPDWEPEDEDDENMLQFLATRTALSATATVPLARDLIQGAISDYGYSPTPLTAFGENLIKTFESTAELMDEEVEWEDSDKVKALKPLVMTLGTLFGIPAVQPTRFLDGWAAQLDEEENWSYFDLLMGYDKDRAKLRD